MATGKVARRTAVGDVGELLDSPEIAALIDEIDASGDARGRKGYGTRALVGACLVKTLFGLPTWTRVAALIAEHPGLQAVLSDSPSVWACYRFTVKLRANQPLLSACLDRVADTLRTEFPGIGQDVCIDATDLPAFANGRGEADRHFSDPDASWGRRSAVSNRPSGSFYGYKLHAAVCSRTGLPLAWHIETGRRQESLYVPRLLDAVQARGFRAETCAMDKGYDHPPVYQACVERNCRPVVPLRATKNVQGILPCIPPDGSRMAPFIPRGSNRFADLYRARSAVERAFAVLKTEYALTPLRVRGIERVALHTDLTMLARLAQALSQARERAIPLAA